MAKFKTKQSNKLLSSDRITSEIIQDAKCIRERIEEKPKRSEAMFYGVVTGGSTSVAADVLNTVKAQSDHQPDNKQNSETDQPKLQQNSDRALYEWLLGHHTSSDDCERTFTEIKTSIRKNKLCKIFKLLILIPIWIIFTPFFYICHSISTACFNSRYVLNNFCISKYENLEFPLAFAVLSGEKDMVKLFLNHGIPLDLKDSNGNNVMHYLADLSAYDLPRAMECYRMLWTLADEGCIQKSILERMILDQENIYNRNAIEYCYQYGALKLGSQMMHDSMMIYKMVVVNKKVTLPATERNADDTESLLNPNKLTHSTDDTGSPVTTSKNPTEYINNDAATKTLKTISDEKTIVTSNTNSWSINKMMISQYSTLCRNGFMSFILHLMNSRPTTDVSKENWESIQKDKGMQKWMKCKFQQWKYVIIVIIALEFVISTFGGFLLLNADGDMFITPNKEIMITNHVQTFLTYWQRNDSSTTGIDTNLRSSFFSAYSDLEEVLAQDEYSMDYTKLLALINKLNGYENYRKSDLIDLYDQLCINGSVYQKVGDLVYMDNCTIAAADAILVDCHHPLAGYRYRLFEERFSNPYEFVVASSFQSKMFNGINSLFRNGLRLIIHNWAIYLLLFGLVVYFFVYLVLDVYCRLYILVKQITNSATLYSIFATPLPGSYVKGQCKVSIGYCYLLLIMYYMSDILTRYRDGEQSDLKDEILDFDLSLDDNARSNFIMSVALVFLFVCSIILHLYSFRLLPLIGNFVITTFEMASDLFQFTFIYVLVVLAFSTLFYWFSRSTNCPFYRDANNIHMGFSIFTTFAATFGHIDIEFTNLGLRIVYVVFVVMSIILLLNLIIAVMTSTASQVTVEPWKSQLSQEALNSEALGIEHWMCTLFFYRKDFIQWTLQKAGFKIEESADKNFTGKIYLEYFEKIENGQIEEQFL